MGREIRRVPPNWEHPRWNDDALRQDHIGEYRSCFDRSYEEAAQAWVADFNKWEPKCGCQYLWEYESPPNPKTHRPAFTEDPTWYQLYQTVSEGSPVSPPFETEEELIEYLCTYGDFWCQKRAASAGPLDPIPTRAQAEALVRGGDAPPMVLAAGRIMGPAEAAEFMGKPKE
jgi:hypothetical protein